MSEAEKLQIAVFERHRPVALRILARRLGSWADAEDALQDAVLRVMELPAEKVVENPGAYLVKAALNAATDRQRSNQSRDAREREWTDSRGPDQPPPADQALMARQELGEVLALLRELSPSVRNAFLLHRAEGLPQAEVAERLGLSRSTVEKHVAKAMRHLLDRLSGDGMEAGAPPLRHQGEEPKNP
ncbi:RNA polymerase sigma factor [Parvularcula lutaonensis]|uniref:RNA polymerase sigma factor n=1 Tax=Parvularcula lutaonensis TaxID=491923 RepID=A0ABV7MEV5_9PROT|nr:sigma-70 family RNA polymerase sigma factor [Parvularcula lutaonensis]GGY55701.1 DNA-directed RNA polymerase sigma-70 factor [Parvularcula lutaonensis]